MVAVTSGKVLVSGANGFVAAWVVKELLDQGYSVRGAVRSEAKGAHLKKIFASHGDKFEIAVVPDITVEGAFDEAVKGVDAIEHTASPFHFQADDPAEIIDPAVKGTVSILHSALKHGKNVKRIVLTGSVVSVFEMGPPKQFTEVDWNNQAPKMIEAKGRDAPPFIKYAASKTLAERALWDFVEKHKSEITWDASVVIPPYVFGPTIHETPTPADLGTSTKQFHDILKNGGPAPLLLTTNSWIDVRDLSRAHVLGLQKPEAGGERIIVTAGKFVWQEWLDIAPAKFNKGLGPGGAKDAVYAVTYDNAKSIKVLGLTYRTKEETLRDTVADWEARGW